MAKKKTPKKSESVPEAVEEVYFKYPHFLKRWHEALMHNRWLRGGILALILAALGLGGVALAYRLSEPPSIATFLPVDETVAYVEFDRTVYENAMEAAPPTFPWNPSALNERLSVFLPEPGPLLPDWVGDHVGIAWVLNEKAVLETWIFLEMETDPTTLEQFFESDPDHEWKSHGYMVMGPRENPEDIEDPLMWKVNDGEVAALAKDSGFLQLRPHLAYDSAAFGYVNPDLLTDDLLFGELTKIKPLFPWVPAMGFTLDAHSAGVILQTYSLGDKSLMDGEPLFHLDEKYSANLIAELPDTVVSLKGGQDLGTTWTQLVAVFNAVDGVTGDLLEGWLREKIEAYVGEELTLDEFFYPLLSEEYAVGWTHEELCAAGEGTDEEQCWVEERPLLALELDEEQLVQMEQLIDALLAHGLFETSDATLYHVALELVTEQHGDTKFNAIRRDDGKDLFQYRIDGTTLYLTTSVEDMNTWIDGDARGSFPLVHEVAASSDHVSSKASMFPGVKWMTSGINLFDDGVRTLHILEFTQP